MDTAQLITEIEKILKDGDPRSFDADSSSITMRMVREKLQSSLEIPKNLAESKDFKAQVAEIVDQKLRVF